MKTLFFLFSTILFSTIKAQVLVIGDSHIATSGGLQFDFFVRKFYQNQYSVNALSYCGAKSFSFTTQNSRQGYRNTCGVVQILELNSPALFSYVHSRIDSKIPRKILSSQQYYVRSSEDENVHIVSENEKASYLKEILTKTSPHTIFISLGTNEFSYSPQFLTKHYLKMNSMLKESNIKECYIMGMPYFFSGKKNQDIDYFYDQIYPLLESCEILDGRLQKRGKSYFEYHSSDGIHLNQFYYQKWAEKIWTDFLKYQD